MKMDRKNKAEKKPPVPKGKSSRRVAAKTNGRHPLAAYEHIPIGIVETSLEGNYLDVNEEFCRILGYTRDELLQFEIKDCTHEDDYAIDSKLYEQLIAGKIPFYRLEKRYIRKSGESIWVELTRTLVCDEKGNPLHTMGVVLDISDRKDVERVLRRSVERLRLATETARMFMWEWDLQTGIYTVDDNFEKVIGFSGGLLPKDSAESVQRLMPPEDRQVLSEAVSEAASRHADLHSVQVRFVDPASGQVVWLEINGKIVYDEAGNAIRIIGATQNITQNKKIQDEIKLISRMPEENPNPVMRLTPDGHVIYANGPSKIMLDSWKAQDVQTIPDELQIILQDAYATGMKKEVEIAQNEKTFSCTLAPIRDGGYVNFYADDITARKQAQEKLRESEERFRALVNQATAGIAQSDPDGRLIFVNPKFCEMLDYSQEELLGKTIWELTYTEDLQENRRLFQRMMTEEKSYQLEKRFLRKDGSTRWTNVSVTTVHDSSGKPTGGVGVMIDTEERKQAEAALTEYVREQEALFQLADQLHRTASLQDVFDAALDAILNALQCDRASILLYDEKDVMRFVAWRGLSEEYRNATDGHSPWKPDAKDPTPIRMDDVRTADLDESLREVIQGEGIGALAFIPLVVNEKLIGKFMIYYNAPHTFEEAELDLSLTIARQLAFGVDRKRAAEALARERELLTRLFETMPIMLTLYDPVVGLPKLNAHFEQVTGWKSEGMTILSLLESCYPDTAYRMEVVKRLSSSTDNEWVDVRMQTADGRTLDTIWSALRFSNGIQVGIGIDITERKQAEEKIRRLNNDLQAQLDEMNSLLEILPIGVWIGNEDCSEIVGNAAAYRMLGLPVGINASVTNAEPQTPTGMRLFVEGREVEQQDAPMQMVARTGKPMHNFEHEIRFTDGASKTMYASIVPLFDQEGAVRKVIGTYTDMTEHKQAEKRLVLMAEISEMLRNFEDPHELLYTISKVLGEHLHVKRVLFNEIDLEHDLEIVHRDYHVGLESVAGVHKVSAYSSVTSAEVAAGKTVVNKDSMLDPRTAHDYEKTYAISGERSYVVVPMMRDNRWVASLWVSDDQPRAWTKDEVSLLETVAERTWTVIEKLRINNELRESEERLRAMLETTVVGFATLTTNTRFLEVNDAFCRIVGYSREELLGMDCSVLTHPDYVESTNQHVAQLLAGEIPSFVLEKRYIRKDGVQIWVQNSVSAMHDSDGEPISLVVICQDVTERKGMEEQLRVREAELEEIINETPFMLSRCTRDLRYRFVSRAYAEMIGRTPDELEGKPIVEIMGQEGLKTISPYVERVLAGERVEYEAEVSFRSAGAPFLHVIYTPDRDEQGNVIGWFASIVDISERKRAEAALRVENERFMRFVDSNIVGILIGNSSGEIVLANDYYLNLLGVSRQEFLEGKVDWKQFTPPEWLSADEKAIEELQERGVCEPYEKEYVRADGTRVPVYIADALLPGPGKEIAAFVLDISERKRAEEALRESEERYRGIVNQTIGGIAETDLTGRFTMVNDRYCEIVGYTRQQLLSGMQMQDITYPEDLPANQELFGRLRAEGNSFEIEKRYSRADGSIVWVHNSVSAIIGTDGKTRSAVAAVIDVTERKRAEESLRRNEELFSTLVEAAPFGVYFIDSEFRLRAVNKGSEAVFSGIYPLIGRDFAEIIRIVWEEPFATEAIERFRHTLRTGEAYISPTITEPRANIDEIQSYDWQIHRITMPDGTYGVVCYFYDLSEQKKMEATVRASESLYRAIARNIPGGGVYVVDKDFRYLVAEGPVTEAFGLSREMLEGRTVTEAFPDERGKRMEERLRRNLAGETVSFETQYQGRVYWTRQAPLHDSLGHVIILTLDITERKQAEEALRESEERFRAILRQATAGIVRKDEEGRLIFVNQAFCNMLGYTEADLLGKTMWDFMHADDIAENKRWYKRLMQEGIPFKLERRLIREDGSVIWVDASVSPIMDATGRVQSAVTVEVDITPRKQAEEALQQLNLQLEERVLSRTAKLRTVNQTLREEIAERKKVEAALRDSEAAARANEEKLSSLFKLLPVGISFLDPEGKIIEMNPALAHILKLSPDQLAEQTHHSRKYIRSNGTVLPPAEFASQRALSEGKTVYNVETGIVLEDQQVIWTSVSAAPVDVADVGAVVVTADITESKRAERALQESRERLQILSQRLVEVQEEERRAIARELHDRVGQTLAALNINLIIISGQLGGKVDEQISTRLNDSMKLVAETIALVRDVMSNLRPSVLDDYGLEAALESHISQYTSRYEIQVKFDKPKVSIPRLLPGIEMTFLRIAQEALMNIARHAQASHVNLALWQENEAVYMTIKDNGKGITSWQEANRPGSHGLTIMRERAEAFGGNLHVSSTPGSGTKIEVRIPIDRNDASQAQKEMSQ